MDSRGFSPRLPLPGPMKLVALEGGATTITDDDAPAAMNWMTTLCTYIQLKTSALFYTHQLTLFVTGLHSSVPCQNSGWICGPEWTSGSAGSSHNGIFW